MALIYGKKMTKTDILKRTGNVNQFADMLPFSFEDGKARGMRGIACKNGAGLTFTILPDRCMDIAWAEYQGMPFGYMSKSEVCSPEYFVEDGDKGFSNNFHAGLLTTSGLSNVGSSNVDLNKAYGLHGTVGNLPAKEVGIVKQWEEDEYVMSARGKIAQSRFYGEAFELRREIRVSMGDDRICICDEVENIGFCEEPFMLLYHMNFGFPFLSEDSLLFFNNSQVLPRTEEAKKGISQYEQILPPTSGFIEQCFYHNFEAKEDGYIFTGLFHPGLGTEGLGVYLKYQKSQLPYFCQWKMTGEQEYVMGLIPATWYAEGRHEARKRQELIMLQPGESRRYELEIGILHGKKEFEMNRELYR